MKNTSKDIIFLKDFNDNNGLMFEIVRVDIIPINGDIIHNGNLRTIIKTFNTYNHR